MPTAVVGLIAALGVPGLVSAAGGLTALGSVVAAGIGIGLSVGINMLLMQQPKGPKPQDVQNVVRNSVGPRSRHYGRTRIGGSLALIETQQGNLHQVVVFGQGRFEAYDEFIVDDQVVTLPGGSGFVTSYPYSDGGVQVLEIYTRTGLPGQDAIQKLIDALPGIWTADHRLRGIAYAGIIAHSVTPEAFTRIYPNRIPQLNVIARTSRVYDPRDKTTAYTANLALCLRDYIINADGGRMSNAFVDNALFGAAADICDELVPVKGGGTIRRYHGALSYPLNSEPKTVIERFVTAMDGRTYLTPEGKIGLTVGKWIAPTITLTDEHILDYGLEDGAGPFRTANEVIVQYTQVESLYSGVTADPWRDEASISELGAVQSISPEIYEIQHHNHARRIAKILAHRAAPRWVGTIRTTLYGMECFDQRWVNVQIGDLDIDETFEITAWQLDVATMTVVLTVQSFGAEAYEFDPETEEGVAPAVPDDVERQAVPAPESVSLTYEGSGNAISLVVSVPQPASFGVRVEMRYQMEGVSGWKVIDVPLGEYSATSEWVFRDANYVARARFTSGGEKSDWVYSETLNIPPDAVAA